MFYVLNDMEKHFNGENALFDGDYYEKLTTCMAKFDDDVLLDSQNAMWQGMMDYY